jgi:glycerol-3-phosphate O-acyltransferase/dihydroxyacetone phosphate acyltransferase
MIVELNRRLVKGYTHYKDDPRITNLKQSVSDYNKELWRLGVRDHQVEYAKFSTLTVVFTLLYRFAKLVIMAMGTLPGLVLFAPVFVASKIISIKKSREALAASTVKLQGRDVMATWKLLVALAFAPLLYAWYAALLTWWTYRNRVQGYVPDWVPLWMVVVASFVFFPSITFAALRFGETGMDILKSLRPLVLCIYPTSANTLVKLRATRARLSAEVTQVINTLGPEMFPDFDSARIIADPFRDGVLHEPTSPVSPHGHHRNSSASMRSATSSRSCASDTSTGRRSSAQGHLPRNESFGNLGDIGLFASHPPSRDRSRSGSSGGLAGSGGFPVKGFTTINSKGALNEVSQKIRGAMRERGQERRRKSEERSEGWDFADTGTGSATPASEEGKKEI